MNKVRILAMIKNQMDGVTWYRLHNFAREARLQGLAEVEFLDPMLDSEQLYEVLKLADVYYLRIDETFPHIFEELDLTHATKPIVIDIDDSFEDINPLSDMYGTMGTQEVKLPDGTWLWKDGEGGFNLKENKERIESYRKLVKQAHAVIVTTFELKKFAEKFNKNVIIIPNAIDFKLFPILPLKKDNTVTITWSGGASHLADLKSITPILYQIMKERLNVYYCHVGQMFRGVIKDLVPERTKTSGWVTADGHGYRMATLNADIGIAPLIDSDFNRCKSSIKYYEYSALKIPTLAKNMPPYSDDIIDGETGLLYTTPEEFKEKLEYLIDNPLERTRLGENAYKYVFENRNITDIARDWCEFLKELSVIIKENQLKENKAELRVTTFHEFKFVPLKDNPNAEKIMKKGCEILESLGVHYWMSAGTALGLKRDGGFIPHDSDIDVVVVDCDPEEIHKAMRKAGFRFIRKMEYGAKISQLCYDLNQVIFDIEIYYKDDPDNYTFYSESGIIKMPAKFANREFIEFNDSSYPVPAPIEEYLTWRYGDWKTPLKKKDPWQKDTKAELIPYP